MFLKRQASTRDGAEVSRIQPCPPNVAVSRVSQPTCRDPSAKALQYLSGIFQRLLHQAANGLPCPDGIASSYFLKDLAMHLEAGVETIGELDLLQKNRHDRV